MTRKQAIKLAIAEMKKALRLIAFDAAMADKFHAAYPQAVSASRQKKKLLEAIEVLKREDV